MDHKRLLEHFVSLGENKDGPQSFVRFAAFYKGYRVGRRSFLAGLNAQELQP
jgi:hypothetical protein